MYNTREYIPVALTSGSQVIFTGKGILHGIVVGTTTATAVQFADSATANVTSGTFMILKPSITEGAYIFDATVANGLVVASNVISGTYTVLYTK